MNDARRRHNNLFMGWLDVKKAFDSVHDDWILHSLRLFCVHDKIVKFFESCNVSLVYCFDSKWSVLR